MPLPQKQPDRYQDVDILDFSTASEMTVAELTTMGDIATQRGEGAAAFEWKSLATEKIRVEGNKQNVERMMDAFTPRELPPPGSAIMEPIRETWAGDSQYRDLRVAFDRAKAEADELEQGTHTGDPELVTLRNKQADAWGALSAREADIKEGLSEVGAWTEQDERIQAAQRQLEIKAEQVAAQFSGGT